MSEFDPMVPIFPESLVLDPVDPVKYEDGLLVVTAADAERWGLEAGVPWVSLSMESRMQVINDCVSDFGGWEELRDEMHFAVGGSVDYEEVEGEVRFTRMNEGYLPDLPEGWEWQSSANKVGRTSRKVWYASRDADGSCAYVGSGLGVGVTGAAPQEVIDAVYIANGLQVPGGEE